MPTMSRRHLSAVLLHHCDHRSDDDPVAIVLPASDWRALSCALDCGTSPDRVTGAPTWVAWLITLGLLASVVVTLFL